MEEHSTAINIPGHDFSVSHRLARTALTREADKKHMETLEELQRSTFQLEESVYMTVTSYALHKSSLFDRVAGLLIRYCCYKPSGKQSNHVVQGHLVKRNKFNFLPNILDDL